MEEWKPVAGFEGAYEVSSFGRIRSLFRIVPMVDGRKYTVHDRVLVSRGVGKYQQVCLKKDTVRTYVLVHRLVLETFIGSCPDNMECRHLDGNRSNNRLENLKWGTRKENAEDKQRHGTTSRGESSGVAKLTDQKVREILAVRELGCSLTVIARKFGVSKKTILNIVHRRIWKHIKEK